MDERIPCRYYMFGCVVKPLETERLAHQEMCIYRYCGCPSPFDNCKWQGRIMEAVEHLTTIHRLRVLQGHEVIFSTANIFSPRETNWAVLQSCYDNHFILVLIRRHTSESLMRFLAVVKLVGSRNKAETFKCRMELVRGDKLLVWQGKPQCLYDDACEPDLEADCLIFNYNTAVLFTDNRTLNIKVTVTIPA